MQTDAMTTIFNLSSIVISCKDFGITNRSHDKIWKTAYHSQTKINPCTKYQVKPIENTTKTKKPTHEAKRMEFSSSKNTGAKDGKIEHLHLNLKPEQAHEWNRSDE